MKKLSFFLMAMLVSLTSFAAALGEGYEKVTDISTLAAGDKVVLYCDDSSIGVTGVNGTKDAAVAATGWVEYLVEAATGGVKLKDTSANKYISLTTKNSFTYATAGSVCKVNAKGVLGITLSGTDYFLYNNGGNYYRMYTDKTGNASYKPFYVYKVVPVEVDPDATMYTVTVKSADETMGTVSGSGEYAEGSTATLEATPKAGYKFVNWSNGSTDNPLKITVTEDVEVTANFEAIPPMTCAEATAAVSGATVVLNPFDVVAVVKGAGYIYIKDESGVALIFDFNLDDQLKAGDHVEGFVGVSSPYNGLPELKPSVAFADLTVTPGTAPEPTLFTEVPTKADLNKYVKFENVTLTANATFTTSSATNATMVVNGKNVTLRNTFKLAATLSKDKAYNIVGFAAIYNSTIQVYFLSAEEYVAPEPCTLATPVNWDAPIAAEANTDQWYAVNVASAIEAGKDLALTVTNPGTEAVEITIEAYADCPATELIVKSTKTFNAGETKTTTVKYDDYLADQVEVVYLHVVTSGDLTIDTEAIEPCSKATAINWNDPIAAAANLDAWYAVNIASAKEAAKDLDLTISNPSEEAVKVSVEVYADCPATELIAKSTATINAGASKTKTVGYFDIFADLVDVIYFHVITEGGAINVEAETVKFNVTATAENGTVEGAGIYEQGAEATLTATPAEGYEFVNWTVEGTEVSSENPYKFTVTADVALVANFKKAAPATETVYFINTKKWANVTAHAWGAKLPDTKWPGLATVKEAEQIAGYDVYSFTANVGDYANVIFNNKGGGSQTPDLVWTAGKYYVMDMGWLTKEEAETKLAAPLPEVWTIVGAAGLMGKDWDLNAAENAMTLQADGTYKLEKKGITLTAGTYEYKAAKDHGWTVAVPQDGNQSLKISTSGIYDVTFVLNVTAKKLTATATLKQATVVIPTIVIAGDMNGWNQTKDKFTMAADSLTATFKATLTAKSYGFKMIVGGSWHSDGKTITRAANSTKFTGANSSNNSTLKADIAGEYLFTWEYATKTLTVTYPALPVKYNVTVTAENGTVKGAGEYEQGATATLTATPDEGYEFVNWTVGEEVVSTDNPYSFVVTADVALVANFAVVKPEVITYELNGGEFPAVVVPTNAELWEAFKPYYNTYYGLARADQPIDKVSTFASAKMQEIMTDEASEYKWLGDYVQSVATAAGVPLSTDMAAANEGGWRWAVHAFFNAAAGQHGAAGIDFTEAGKQEVWGAAYEAEYGVVLPTEPVAEDYVLPTPTKEGYTFVGWYDNAEGTGEPYKVIPAGWTGTLYAIWKANGPTTNLDNIAVEGKAVKAIINGQLVIIKNGVQYNAQGAILK